MYPEGKESELQMINWILDLVTKTRLGIDLDYSKHCLYLVFSMERRYM